MIFKYKMSDILLILNSRKFLKCKFMEWSNNNNNRIRYSKNKSREREKDEEESFS